MNGAGKSAIYAYSIRHTYGHQPESERSCISCIIRQICVNARYLLRSVQRSGKLGATDGRAPCVTWDVITRLHQTGR